MQEVLLILLMLPMLNSKVFHITSYDQYEQYKNDCIDCFILIHNPWCKVSQRLETSVIKADLKLQKTMKKLDIQSHPFSYLSMIDETTAPYLLNNITDITITSLPRLLHLKKDSNIQWNIIPYKGQYTKNGLYDYIIGILTRNNHGEEHQGKNKTNGNVFRGFNENTINELIMKRQTGVILFRNKYDNQTMTIESDIIKNISLAYNDTLFIITDITNKYELKLMKLLHVNPEQLPQIRYVVHNQNGHMLKYHYETSKINKHNLLAFIIKCRNGECNPYYNSESIKLQTNPNITHSVKELSRLTYHSYIFYSNKAQTPIMILLYTKWCLHCKKVSIYPPNINHSLIEHMTLSPHLIPHIKFSLLN